MTTKAEDTPTLDDIRDSLREISEDHNFRFGLGTTIKIHTRKDGEKRGLLFDVGNHTVTLRIDDVLTPIEVKEIDRAYIVLSERFESLPLKDGLTDHEAMILTLEEIVRDSGDVDVANKARTVLDRVQPKK